LRYPAKIVGAQPANRRGGVVRTGDAEVDVIEGIQKISAEFNVDPLGDLRLLGQVQIEARELRPVKKDGRETALPA
jgi:hypothetical protein